MDLYLAGATSGGNVPRDVKEKIFSGEALNSDLYLAGNWPWREQGLYDAALETNRIFVLESFYYVNEWTEKFIPRFGKFLLDSGAFTYVGTRKDARVDWIDYVDRYADFINRNNVDLFFELDIDKLIGYRDVLKLRKRLEMKTGKQCIPVWHKTRGKDDFINMCKEYPYVSIGGLVGAGGAGATAYSASLQKYFPWFIDTAHKHGAKIHALGFTNLKGLEKYHFDSVDSTSWTSGNRFGVVHVFTGKTMIQKKRKPNERMVNTHELALYNFNEWVKFQRYAEKYL